MMEELEEKLNGNWAIKQLREPNLKYTSIYISPSLNNNGLPLFDKIIVDRNYIEMSTIGDKQELKKLIKCVKSCIPKERIKVDQEILNQNLNASKTVDVYQLLETCIKSCFSKGFINENQLEKSNFEKLFPISKRDKGIKGNENYTSIRFEESFEKHKVILSFSPISNEFRLGILKFTRHVSDFRDYFNNIVPLHFEYKYEYEKYYRAIKHNHVTLIEQQGAPQYPDATYNDQSFIVDFRCYNIEDTPLNAFAKSANAQRKFLTDFIKLIYILYGNDLNGNGYRELKNDIQIIPKILPDNIQKKEVKLCKGYRLYSNPNFDLQIVFNTSIYEDDNCKEFNVAGLHTNLIPFKTNKLPGDKWFLHPMVYEWGK
jgi:hypothetical protein